MDVVKAIVLSIRKYTNNVESDHLFFDQKQADHLVDDRHSGGVGGVEC